MSETRVELILLERVGANGYGAVWIAVDAVAMLQRYGVTFPEGMRREGDEFAILGPCPPTTTP